MGYNTAQELAEGSFLFSWSSENSADNPLAGAKKGEMLVCASVAKSMRIPDSFMSRAYDVPNDSRSFQSTRHESDNPTMQGTFANWGKC